MLKWYSITSPSPDGLRSVLKSLRSQHLMVRKQDEHLVACVSTDHQAWLSNVCQDFHAKFQLLEEAPAGVRVPSREVYKTPCGMELYDPVLYSRHFKSCPKCKPDEAKVVAKLEPGQPHNLNGVIASLEVARDQLMEKCETVDNIITNLKAYRDAKEKLSELHVEVDKRVDAVKLLVIEGRLPK